MACALAEEIADASVGSLIWLDLECLIVQAPALFVLDEACDVAVRPVHVRNIGLPAHAPPDRFWRGIYRAVGVDDIDTRVETFIGGERLRAYYNSHGLAVRSGLGLFTRWRSLFADLLNDEDFVRDACTDIRHPTFLFQAVFSALVAASVPAGRIRLLPPAYNYPYNLHGQVPPERRARLLNDLVCLTFEDRTLDPARVTDIEIHEPLRSFLAARALPQDDR